MEEIPLIECLPPEILAHVFHFLDHPAPSDQQLHDQPHADMLRRQHDTHNANILKNASRVNKRWRVTVLPLLFRNVVWYLDRFDLMQAEQFKTSPAAIPMLPFLCAHNLSSYVKSFTLVVTVRPPPSSSSTSSASQTGSSEGRGNSDVGLYRRGDGSGHYGYIPAPLSPSPGRWGGERDLVYNEDTNWLWKLIFDVVSPLRFTIIASPRMLASLLARMLFLGDAWSFAQSHHVLSLSRGGENDARRRWDSNNDDAPPSTGERSEEEEKNSASNHTATTQHPSSSSSSSSSLARPAKRVPCELFTTHPWNSLLLNEGSSTRVYKTYEYFHKRPPSMLGALLGAEEFPNDEALIPPTVSDFNYVGIFPLSSHFGTLVQHLPRVRRLFVQLVPRNDILRDRKEMEHLDMDDLWAERNRSYESIVPKLFGSGGAGAVGGGNGGGDADPPGNWEYLQEFESGDAVDFDRWELAVDFMAMGFSDWTMEREGVFVKREPQQQRESILSLLVDP